MMEVLFEQSLAFVVGIVSSVVASVLWIFLVRRAETRFSFSQIVDYVLNLVNQIENDEFRPDVLIAIDRNSTVVGGIVAGHLGLRTILTVATENRRLGDGTREIGISPGYAPNASLCAGKRILLFICFNDSGTSLETVLRYLNTLSPRPEVRTAALFTSASPKILPSYSVRRVGLNLRTPVHALMPKMPWVTKSWKFVFARERLARDDGQPQA